MERSDESSDVHQGRCSLLEGGTTIPSTEKKPKKLHVDLKQWHNSGSP